MKIINIGGCTGVGKTDIALKLSKSYKVHLISCDSVQVYKELNIATNKPQEVSSHSLIDLTSVNDPFDINKFKKYTESELNYCKLNNLNPIIVGGTGLYMETIHTSFKFFLTRDRTSLYRKTDLRCEQMVLEGLLNEALDLKKSGLGLDSIPGRAIGYRDAFIFINSLCSDDNINYENFIIFIKNFQKRTRNYIRKQETWARSRNYVWINTDTYDAYNIIKRVFEEDACFFMDSVKEMDIDSRKVNFNAKKILRTYCSELHILNECNIKKIISELQNKIR